MHGMTPSPRGRNQYAEEAKANSCPCHSLFKGHKVIVNNVVLNCQQCNQCLKCQVSGHKISKNLKIFQTSEIFQKMKKCHKKLSSWVVIISCHSCDRTLDTWDTDYLADNWEQQYKRLLCDLWIKSDRDSIRNSCDVSLSISVFSCPKTVFC